MKNIEIERKFLVNASKLPDLNKLKFREISQCYVTMEDDYVERVRLSLEPDGTYLCELTRKSAESGMSRTEETHNISLEEAIDKIKRSPYNVIHKKRYIYWHNTEMWEIDIFGAECKGLIVAEVEIPSEDWEFELPSFVTEEVTDKKEYYNKELTLCPVTPGTTD